VVNININMILLFGSLRLKSVEMVGLGLNTVMNGLYRFKIKRVGACVPQSVVRGNSDTNYNPDILVLVGGNVRFCNVSLDPDLDARL